jgi:integrase
MRGYPVTASSAIQFCVLTACRTNEAIGARWSEFDLERRVWTIPAARMKAGKEHRVPLSEPTLRLLERLAEEGRGDYVFPGRTPGKSISDRTMLALLERMGRADITVHGFRATFKTWATEQTNFPSELAEHALAHTVGSAVERAYLRSDQFDKRRQLAEAWASYCDSTSTGTVRHLRSASA